MTQPTGPFIGTEAVAAGLLTRRTLATRCRLVYRNVYLPPGAELTPATRAVAAWLWSQRKATVAGLSAAALHGTEWIDVEEPAELTRTSAGANDIVVHRERLRDDELCAVRGIPTTTPARTAFDLSRRGSFPTALIAVDALANATGVTSAEVRSVTERHAGARGIVQGRRVINWMDGGAESPQESRTRLLLLESDMRRPTTQIKVYDDYGHAFARIDMGWPDLLVGVEYDGAQHWTDAWRRSRDIDRYAELAKRGWHIIRVSAELLRDRPWVIVARVLEALQAHGCPWIAECRLPPRISHESVA